MDRANPAARKRRDLKNACATSCAVAAATEPTPTAMSMSPYCAVVEAAKARLKSVCSNATTPPASALTSPRDGRAEPGDRLKRGLQTDEHVGAGCDHRGGVQQLSLIHISEPTRLGMISYAVFCL